MNNTVDVMLRCWWQSKTKVETFMETYIFGFLDWMLKEGGEEGDVEEWMKERIELDL